MIHKPFNVVLLEDNRDDEKLALRALRSCGLPLCVRLARDGEEALRILGISGHSDPIHVRVPSLIISDLKMPKLNGDEVLRRARSSEALKGVPFVIFSSSDEKEDVDRCLRMGADAYYTKPVDYIEYLQCMGQIARHWLLPAGTEARPYCDTLAGRETSPPNCAVF